jgi:hypothetical protein
MVTAVGVTGKKQESKKYDNFLDRKMFYLKILYLFFRVISGFRRQVDKNCNLLGNYHYTLRNYPEECSSCFTGFVTKG